MTTFSNELNEIRRNRLDRMKTICLNEINENDFFEWIEWKRLFLKLNKNHFFKWVEWKRFLRMKTTCSRFKAQRIVRALSEQSKNSMFKYVVLIELEISNSLNFELEISNSIKTTYLKNSLNRDFSITQSLHLFWSRHSIEQIVISILIVYEQFLLYISIRLIVSFKKFSS
jgi:hypothetical protein